MACTLRRLASREKEGEAIAVGQGQSGNDGVYPFYNPFDMIPECNNHHLARLELEMQNAAEAGYDAVRGLDRLGLYQWMSTVFYGLLFKELSLAIDRSRPDAGSIIHPDILEMFRTLHGFLHQYACPLSSWVFSPGRYSSLGCSSLATIVISIFMIGMTFAIRFTGV